MLNNIDSANGFYPYTVNRLPKRQTAIYMTGVAVWSEVYTRSRVTYLTVELLPTGQYATTTAFVGIFVHTREVISIELYYILSEVIL